MLFKQGYGLDRKETWTLGYWNYKNLQKPTNTSNISNII